MTQIKKEDLDLEISERVRELRLAKGLSYRGLASKAQELGYSITFAWISELEKGRRKWGLKSLCAVAAVLEVSPGELIEGDTNMIQGKDEQDLINSWRVAGAVGVLAWLSQNFPTGTQP